MSTVSTILYRFLQEVVDNTTAEEILNNATTNFTNATITTNSPTLSPTKDLGPPNGGSGDRGAYEFVAFILWYLFLVVCCIVPTCCAYRRRRMLQGRYNGGNSSLDPPTITLEQLQQLQQLQQVQQQMQNGSGGGGVFLLPSLQQQQHLFRSAQDLMESDTAKAERTKRLETSLEQTTFVVQEGDVVEGYGSSTRMLQQQQQPTSDVKNPATTTAKPGDLRTSESTADESQEDDIMTPEQQLSAEDAAAIAAAVAEDPILSDVEITSMLRLPSTKEDGSAYVNANRSVPGVCAICLCGYEVGDKVTWSGQIECQHVFHHECIVPWLAKKNEAQPQCPCCRQVYCNVEPITLLDLINARNATATTTGSTTTTAMTPFEFMMAVRSGGSSLFFPQDFQSSSNRNAFQVAAASNTTPVTVVAHYNSPYSSNATTPPTGSGTPTPPSMEDIEEGNAMGGAAAADEEEDTSGVEMNTTSIQAGSTDSDSDEHVA